MRKALTFDDVCLRPQFSDIVSRREPDLSTDLTKSLSMNIPLLASNMDTVINDRLAKVLLNNGSVPIFHRFTTVEQQAKWLDTFGNVMCAISTGLIDDTNNADLYELIIEHGARIICIDVAHGHSESMMRMITELKGVFQHEDLQIIAGNVCTANAYVDLVNAGADAIKVGVGCGAACTTRIRTGHGVPQLSAILECAEQVRKYQKPIIADGGIRDSGDIVKALAAGASSVMIGKLFALTDESAALKQEFTLDGKPYNENEGKIVTNPRNESMEIFLNPPVPTTIKARYRGQASKEFQEEFYGGLREKTCAEGEAFWAPVSGPAQNLIDDLLGGIRSGMTYGGARDIEELQRKAEFVEVTPSYQVESSVRSE